MVRIDNYPAINTWSSGLQSAQPRKENPGKGDLPKITITSNGLNIENVDITGVQVYKARDKFTARIMTLRGEVFIIRGRFKSEDVKTEEAPEDLNKAADIEEEARQALDEISPEDEGYDEAVRMVADIHLNGLEIAKDAAGLLKPENDHRLNIDIANGAGRVIKSADVFRKSKHFEYLVKGESGRENKDKITLKIVEKMHEAATELVSKLIELGIEIDPDLYGIISETNDYEDASSKDPTVGDSDPFLNSSYLLDFYNSARYNLDLIEQTIRNSREHDEKVKENLAKEKEDEAIDDQIKQKRSFENKCAEIRAFLNLLSACQDPEEARGILITLSSMLETAIKQFMAVRGMLPPRTADAVEMQLKSVKKQIEILMPGKE